MQAQAWQVQFPYSRVHEPEESLQHLRLLAVKYYQLQYHRCQYPPGVLDRLMGQPLHHVWPLLSGRQYGIIYK